MRSELPTEILSKSIVSSVEKTALVLSSGGLFGAYQAGVWSYLSEASFRPDVVVGASVGALNGWAIAGGCPASELVDQWLDETRSNVLQRRQNAGWRAGYFERGPLLNLTSKLFSDYRPAGEFGLVTVELPFMRSRLFTGSAVTADHLLATASIPLAMPAVSIDGRKFTDGGLLEDVPLWAAIKMGATRIIAVDAMHFNCPWWYRAGVSPMGLFAPRTPSRLTPPLILIRPSQPLGDYRDALSWKRSMIQKWLDLGYIDARQRITKLLRNEAFAPTLFA